MAEFAGVMPVIAFLTLINEPVEDYGYLRKLSGQTFPSGPESARAWEEMSEYVRKQIDLRRTEPRGDLISSLLTAKIDGRTGVLRRAAAQLTRTAANRSA